MKQRYSGSYMQTQKIGNRLIASEKQINTTLYTQARKNIEIKEHSSRVSQLCKLLGIAMKLSDADIFKLEISGLFHDIGKVYVKAEILNKPGLLTREEWREIERHPEIGYFILSKYPGLKGIAKNVLYHHERYDGSGYPVGLKQEEIPLLSRVIAVVDSYDAMTNQRPYKETLDEKTAILELIGNKERQFDPIIVDIFIETVLKADIK